MFGTLNSRPRQKWDPVNEEIVSSSNIWHKMNNYDKMSNEQKERVYLYLISPNTAGYRIRWHIADLMKKLDDKEKIFALFGRSLEIGSSGNEVKADFFCALKADKDRCLNMVRSFKAHSFNTALLVYGSSLGDEVLGLRALSKSKYAPDFIFTEKYQPSLEALNQLPPVMRLKAIESLTSNEQLGYNVFGKITDAEEFRKMLFASVLRHRDRVERVWTKFNELCLVGKQSVITATMDCSNCGKYSVTLNSSVVSTESKLRNTSIGRWLFSKNCPICRRNNLKDLPQINGLVEI